MGSAGGIEPSGSAGEARRALQSRGLHDGRDGGRCSSRAWGAPALSLALYDVLSCGLVELTTVSVNVGSTGGVGGGTRVGRGSVGGVGPGRTRKRHLGGGTAEKGPLQVVEGCEPECLFCV